MFPHRQIRSALLALSVLTYTTVTPSFAQDTEDSSIPIYRSAVSEVRVTFFATDENNHALETLTQSDFAVVDNERVVRNFRSFTHSAETSLDVVVLVDLSGSVAPRLRVALSDVLQLVAQEQSILGDNISVLSFGGAFGGNFAEKSGEKSAATVAEAWDVLRPAVLCTSGCRAPDSMNRLQTMKCGNATPLFDALVFAADFISQNRSAGGPSSERAERRPVLILFSDGYDTISMHSAQEAVQAVLDQETLIYSVDMGKSNIGKAETQLSNTDPSNHDSGSPFLRRVSEATGGRYFSFFPDHSRPDGAAAVLNAVLEDLRASYVVTYSLPSRETGFHSLRLMPTHNLNLTFHSRNSYDYEPSGP